MIYVVKSSVIFILKRVFKLTKRETKSGRIDELKQIFTMTAKGMMAKHSLLFIKAKCRKRTLFVCWFSSDISKEIFSHNRHIRLLMKLVLSKFPTTISRSSFKYILDVVSFISNMDLLIGKFDYLWCNLHNSLPLRNFFNSTYFSMCCGRYTKNYSRLLPIIVFLEHHAEWNKIQLNEITFPMNFVLWRFP